MSNHLMFWRSAGLDQTIHKNRPQRFRSERSHVPCSDHSPAELAAFERSLQKGKRAVSQARPLTRH